MLRQKLRLEEETPLGLYLGCRISKGDAPVCSQQKPRGNSLYSDEEFITICG